MKIISCAWTTPAVEAHIKTCTRRGWPGHYAKQFHLGDMVQLYNKLPRCHGSLICLARLTADPILQSTAEAPETDWIAEGFQYLSSIGATVNGFTPEQLWAQWHDKPELLWVVRFEYPMGFDALHAPW